MDIPQDLLKQLETIARQQGITVGALLERTLRQAVTGAAREPTRTGRIEPVVAGGDGLREDGPADSWDRIRHFAYDDRAAR